MASNYRQPVHMPARLLGAFLCLVCVSPLWADSHGGQKDPVDLEAMQEEWSEAIESLKGYSATQRDAAVEEAGETLKEMDEQIAVLQDRTVDEWGELSEEARAARLKAMRELAEQRKELAEWYGGMKHSSAQAWGEVKDGFIDAYTVLQDSWREALNEFED